jgi:hypothetical protein
LSLKSIVQSAFREIDTYLKEIARLNAEKINFCEIISSNNPHLSSLPPHLRNLTYDERMFSLLSPHDISGLTIGAVDGGYVSRRLIGFDFFVFRAIAVFSTYTTEGILKTSYLPSKTPPLEVAISDVSLSSIDSENMGSIRRAITELQVAAQVLELETKKVDILLLDGSPVIKQPLSKNKKILNYYQTYLSILTRLVSKSQESRVKLVWIVKDSRINLFSKFLGQILPFIVEDLSDILSLDYRAIINRSRDMDLFYYLLKPNTRSLVYYHQFKMPREFGKDFALYAFYLKTAPYDIPLRIEVFQSIQRSSSDLIKEVNALAEAILPLSQYNREYGIPAPIVEADARVKIKEAEIDSLFHLIRIRHPTPDLWVRRRERAPWKF